MKRVLPIFLVVIVVLGLVVGGFIFLKGSNKTQTTDVNEEKEEALKQLTVEESPYVSLTPTTDGHQFHLIVTKIPSEASMLEYELVYKVASGVTQGVPGTVKTNGQTKIERDLLLGTCSSGKCRYDEGVEKGTFTVRLRNMNGKLLAKMETPFHLQKGASELSLGDGKFTLTSNGMSKNSYFLTMGTFGLPESAPSKVISGPFGVFSKDLSSKASLSSVKLESEGTVYAYSNNKWVEVKNGTTPVTSIFIVTSN